MTSASEIWACECKDCCEPAEVVTRWDLIGAPAPSFNCATHAQQSKVAGRPQQTFSEYQADTAE